MRGLRWRSGAKPRRAPGSEPDTRRAHGRATVVRCLDAWREAAYDVEAAARRWRAGPADDREAAASGFFAALEREEKAATEYERAWRSWTPAAGQVAVER
jgi:hypothetical protein